MNTKTFLILSGCTAILGGCATVAPTELVDARENYRRASTGPAAKAAPAEVHMAHQALDRAENSFEQNGDAYQTRDLAYVAQRKAQIAEMTASLALQREKNAGAQQDYRDAQGEIIERKDADLDKSRSDLKRKDADLDRTRSDLSDEQDARAAAEKAAADAQAALAKLAAVKDEPRGTVITLSGSVLFASNQAVLLPAARTKLEQVTDVLLTSRERRIVIEGHTDSKGSDAHNHALSQRRADAVRDSLVQRGYEADLIRSNGVGEGRPIADNGSAEGRANNRRVEIIIQR